MESRPIILILMIIFSERFQISPEFKCSQDARRMTAELTVKKNTQEESYYIRVRKKDMVELAAYSPPNKVLYHSNDTITGMRESNTGWFIILETKYSRVIHVEIDSEHKPWNSTIPVKCATGKVFLHFIISNIECLYMPFFVSANVVIKYDC